MTARNEDARGPRRTDERKTVDGARTRADPLVLAVVEVGTLEERAGALGDGLDPASVEGSLGLAELHHACDAEPVTDRRAGDACGGEVHRTVRQILDLHGERVATTAWTTFFTPNGRASWPSRRAGRDDELVVLLGRAGLGLDDDATPGVAAPVTAPPMSILPPRAITASPRAAT